MQEYIYSANINGEIKYLSDVEILMGNFIWSDNIKDAKIFVPCQLATISQELCIIDYDFQLLFRK